MGKCIICGCETKDFRCCARKDKNGNSYDDYQCEKCTVEQVRISKRKYFENFNKKVLPYLLENNFKVVVTCGDSKEEFKITDNNIMYCVDIIRKRMKDRGYYENWIDVHWEKYKGIEFEVVDYLCFELTGKENEENWISYHLELVGDNGLELKRRY